jgi:hypothetical protein
MIEKIKSDFYKKTWNNPFESSDYYKFFGYSRHSSFKRFLDQEKYYSDIFLDSFSKINKRERNTISINRKLFVELCQINNCLVKEVEDIAIEYFSSQFKVKINYFEVRLKNNLEKHLKMRSVPCSLYYTYSLNTYNIAKDLQLCPYDLYKFCSTDCGHFEYVLAGITNQYEDYSNKIPFYHFDHTHFYHRNEFLILLEMIMKNYKMSNLSKRLAQIYYLEIKQMLIKQIRIDHLKKEKSEKAKIQKDRKEFNPSQTIKDMYRKACKLYHPDKNPKGEEIFKIINKAYHEGNIAILKK